MFKMPDRKPSDGPIGVCAPSDDEITINATTNGGLQSITMSRYNAARAFGMLAVMLGIRLPPDVGKAIKF